MIKAIITSGFLFCLILAVFLAGQGVTHVDIGQPFYVFMRKVASDYETWSFSIPDIPLIPSQQLVTNGGFIDFLQSVLNVLITFVNFIITLLNTIINVLNVVIKVIQFVLTMIYDIKFLIDTLISDESTLITPIYQIYG